MNGFSMSAARSLLNLSHTVVANLEFHELAALVYRDHLRVKHDPRVRLQQELGKKRQGQKALPKHSEGRDHPNIMAIILLENLIAVPRWLVQFDHVCSLVLLFEH